MRGAGAHARGMAGWMDGSLTRWCVQDRGQENLERTYEGSPTPQGCLSKRRRGCKE